MKNLIKFIRNMIGYSECIKQVLEALVLSEINKTPPLTIDDLVRILLNYKRVTVSRAIRALEKEGLVVCSLVRKIKYSRLNQEKIVELQKGESLKRNLSRSFARKV